MSLNLHFQLQHCNINSFKHKQKMILSKGRCQVYSTNSTLNFKSNVSVLEVSKEQGLVKIRQVSYFTYLFRHPELGCIYSISLPSNDSSTEENVQKIQGCIKTVNFFDLPEEDALKQLILQDCPLHQQYDELGSNNDDKINQLGEGLGNLLGGISSILPSDRINRETQQGISNFSRKSLGDNNISKWEKFKQKISNLNDSAAEKMKPLSKQCGEVVTDIEQKYETSQNSFIKALRGFTTKTKNSLNKGYQKGEEQRRKTYQEEVAKQNQSNFMGNTEGP